MYEHVLFNSCSQKTHSLTVLNSATIIAYSTLPIVNQLYCRISGDEILAAISQVNRSIFPLVYSTMSPPQLKESCDVHSRRYNAGISDKIVKPPSTMSMIDYLLHK
eukprot:NODE_137_length_18042_cov_0.768823.p15 type:complete len:106 gc:universal NODE_137_length_18042_cov_0.768823:13757-14074(+)